LCLYGKDESMPETNIIKPKPGKYGSNSSSVKSLSYSGDDYVVGIKNRKGAEGAGTYKHMAGEHQKREKGKMPVWEEFV
jgi:hypothetical protein